MSSLAKVIIVGRMNVGKSTLFNRLSVDVKSLTFDYAGVTRDFIHDVVSWQGTTFELIDSGGIGLRKEPDALNERVRLLGLQLIDSADLIVFVVDAKAGLTDQDRELSRYLHKVGKQVLVVINKVDNLAMESESYEFSQLGFDQRYSISAQHGRGIDALLEAIVQAIAVKNINHTEKAPLFNVVILGKPNVGKSSLLNLLLNRDRALVSPIAGTTREAIEESVTFYSETLALTDTPGIRRKRGVTETLETMMVKTAFRAVQKADIILLMIDGSQAELSDQELKLLFYAFEQENKAVMLLINKNDLIDEHTQNELEHDFELYERILGKLPILKISCKTGKNVGKIVPMVRELWQRYSQQIDNQLLNATIKGALAKKPLYNATRLLMVYKAKQIKKAPPIIVLFVNAKEWFGQSQLKFFENVLRKKFDLLGVPLHFIVRSKETAE